MGHFSTRWLNSFLENLVYHFFRQLWLVLGVKLLEINSNWFSRLILFSCHNPDDWNIPCKKPTNPSGLNRKKIGAAIFPSNQYNFFSIFVWGVWKPVNLGWPTHFREPPLHFCQLGLVVLYSFVWRERFTCRNSGKWLPNLTNTFHIFFTAPKN